MITPPSDLNSAGERQSSATIEDSVGVAQKAHRPISSDHDISHDSRILSSVVYELPLPDPDSSLPLLDSFPEVSAAQLQPQIVASES